MNLIKQRTRWLAILLVAILVAAGWWLRVRAASPDSGDIGLQATGTIEDRKAALSSQIGGQVVKVFVDEGNPVKAGQTLVQLDDSLLMAQRDVAMAALSSAQTAARTAQAASASAQAQYTAAQTAARMQARSTRLADWSGKTPSYFDQPKWYFTQDEQIAAAQAEVQSAQAGVTDAEKHLATVMSDLKNAQFVATEQRLSIARVSYLVALQVQAEGQAVGSGLSPDQIDLNALHISIPCVQTPGGKFCAPGYKIRSTIAKNLPDQADLKNAAQDAYDAANGELNAAQNAYNDLLSTQQAQDVLDARSALAVANEREQAAADRLASLQTGNYSPQVVVAAAGLEQATSAAQQAQDAVRQAQANVNLIDTQLAKLTIVAPTDGVVLTRSAEVGQMALPGATLIEVGRLDQLELTVYMPEEKFGLVKPGQPVQVSVDAYPDRVFNGTVLRMANEAEFTPTNVQTKEDRTRLVYAAVIQVKNPDLALKPGMIADVTFPAGASSEP